MHLYWNSGFARSIRVLNNETHDVYIVGKMCKKIEKERIRLTNCSFTLINFLCGSLYEDCRIHKLLLLCTTQLQVQFDLHNR